MKLNIPDYVNELMNLLYANNKECWIVGGAIRNYLLGLPIHDYDLTTNALPDEMLEIFKSYSTIKTGLKHGTLTVISHHKPVEITTYRKDTDYKDHRHPSTISFSSNLEEDCARRDFTINALCWNPNDELKDFYDGQLDLQKHMIRCILNPMERFDEDALRILRAIRFASQLNFDIENKTAHAIREKKELLQCISVERIHEELNGILSSKSCANQIDEFREVFEVFLPELFSYDNDTFENMLLSLDRCVNVADIRMAILLTPSLDPHRILNRLKYSTNSTKKILSLIKYGKMNIQNKIDLRNLLKSLSCEFDDYLYYHYALDDTFDIKNAEYLYNEIQNDNYCWNLKDLNINGKDLIELGYAGKDISVELNYLLDEVINENIQNDKQSLIVNAKKK